MKQKLLNIFGWYGVTAILSAYAMVSFDIISAQSLTYHLLNLSGAVGVGIDAWHARNYQPVVINVVLGTIAVVAMVTILFI
jgi:hypothetical protein